MLKNNKKGFFLSETMVVLTVVAVVILSVFKLFTTVYSNFQQSEYYDTANAITALSNVQKYFESIEQIDTTMLGEENPYIDLSVDSIYDSDYFSRIKEEFNIDNVYLVDLNYTLNNEEAMNSFHVTLRKYVKTLKNINGIVLLVVINGNEFASIKLEDFERVTLIGNEDDEYAVYVPKNSEFIDPGYTNWTGEEPTKTWENGIEIDTSKKGTYYLHYDFNGYVLRRKIVVGNFDVELLGNEDDEFAAYIPIGGEFVEPGWKNWPGTPIIEWENGIEPDTTTEGTYYLNYNFGSVITLRRKVVVMNMKTNYAFTDNYETYVVPATGYYEIELWGAQGAASTSKGAYTKGIIKLKKDETLYVYVGESDTGATNDTNFNGGTADSGGSNGGGATDIRLIGGPWNNAESINSRIMVAGGSGSGPGNNSLTKGAGGTLIGLSSGTQGGTQTTFGTSSYTASSFGIANGGCSGGNGYYPGGGAKCASGAGGGSSFISGYAGVNAITSQTDRTHTNNTLHYSNKYFINGTMESGVNEGAGKAKITYVGAQYLRKNTKLDNVRYIKDCINGNTNNSSNHWVELQAIYAGKNVAYGKTVTGTVAQSGSYPYSRITDGNITTSEYAQAGSTGLQCLTIDLEKTYNLDEVSVWHYYEDSRSYKSHSLYVSNDNTTFTTLIDNVSGVVETPNGIRISAYE